MVELQKDLELTPLIRLYVKSTPDCEPLEWVNQDINYKELRSAEKEIASIELPQVDGQDPIFLAVYSNLATSQLEAGLGIATTCVVVVFLGIGAAIFSRITNDLVITPIEEMIDKV